MLTKSRVKNAIHALLVQQYPGYEVHSGREPADFERPAFWMTAPRSSPKTASSSTVLERVALTITCFATVDGQGRSDPQVLDELQEGILGLFRKGFIAVEDRAVKVEAGDGGQDIDRAWVDVTCTYHEERGQSQEQPPIARSVETTMKEGI